ncbi:MAG: amidophosphoribosyltransferase [Kiritimatiellia bacterium]|jgi:amidophosphoribosyltransferase
MGGYFGAAVHGNCATDVFYGTDYHSHLGTMRGGLAFYGREGFSRRIHDITNAPFRGKFELDYARMSEQQPFAGIGIISDYEDQPLLIKSNLGTYAIVTVGNITNLDQLAGEYFSARHGHFGMTDGHGVNPTEMAASLIDSQDSFEAGIAYVQEKIEGSLSLLVLTQRGEIYAARDRYGRTPMVLARRSGDSQDGASLPPGYAVTLESCALPNLGFHVVRELGPGEAVRITPDGAETVVPPKPTLRICSFLWVYYGYPASSYEGVAAENARNSCGAALARAAGVPGADMVSGIPDSGISYALGYAREAGVPYGRPFVKYTPTWARSFLPPMQIKRDEIAGKKLIPIPDLIHGRNFVFCDDSVVRGTQLQEQVRRLYDYGAREIHMRVACPPLLYGCRFLNFSRSRSEDDLIARRIIKEITGSKILSEAQLEAFGDPDSDENHAMVDRICRRLGLTSLYYQRLDDLKSAIGIADPCSLCTYCWNGKDPSPCARHSRH